MIDDFVDDWINIRSNLRSLFERGSYADVLGLLQWVIRDERCPSQFADTADICLKAGLSAYRVIDKSIVPVSSEQETETIKTAFNDLRAAEFNGARQHLRNAAAAASSGEWANSIRESVHAVEATARKLVPDTKELGVALQKLEATAAIHPALRKGFGAIYGFSSDEKGLRHPLIDDSSARVDETDALFMLGACAAFVSYLIGKGRVAGIV